MYDLISSEPPSRPVNDLGSQTVKAFGEILEPREHAPGNPEELRRHIAISNENSHTATGRPSCESR